MGAPELIKPAPELAKDFFKGKDMLRILTVDDEELKLNTSGAIFEMAGFKSIRRDNSNDALYVLFTQEIDLVTQDVCRPTKPDGQGLWEIMQSEPKLRDIPVLFTTQFQSRILPRMKGGSISSLRLMFELLLACAFVLKERTPFREFWETGRPP